MIREWNEKGPVNLVNVWDIFYRDARIIRLFGFVVSSNQVASLQSVPFVTEDIMGSLMLLAQDSNDPMKIVINNGGGSVNDGFAIIQAMEHVKAKGIEVWTFNMCQAASMAANILVMGTKGRRYVQQNTITLFHSGQKSLSGKPEDVDSLYEFTKKHFTENLFRILLENTKIPEYWNRVSDAQYSEDQLKTGRVRLKLLQDFIQGERLLTATEAVEAGVADKVLMPGDPLIDEIYRVKNVSLKGNPNV